MKIEKILFIQPPLECNEKHKKIMPLGIGYLLAVIKKQFPDINLKFIDMQSSNMKPQTGISQALDFKPDVLMMSYWTPMADYAYSIIDEVKSKLSDKLLVISGGVHPSIYPEKTLQYSDIVVKYEGEETIVELLQNLIADKPINTVKGICYKSKDNSITTTPDREFIKDLDKLPFPEWSLMPMDNYDTPMHVTGGKRLPVMGSRGCPYSCSYCVSPKIWKQKLRWRSPENVVDEIETAYNKLYIDKIHFWDDNLFISKKYIKELCEELIKRDLPIIWLGLTRASHIVAVKELMPLIKRSGCIGMEMGIESADPASHKAVDKQENLEITMEAANILKKYNLVPMFTYMALNPGDTLNTYYHQGNFIDKILDGCGWIEYFHPLQIPLYIGQLCTPHPGTKMYDNISLLGKINLNKWTDFYHHRVNFLPYSLLNDIPIKLTEKLSYKEYLICVKGLIGTVYKIIRPEYKLFQRTAIIALFLSFVQKFYNYCNGKKSLDEIIKILETEIQISKDLLWNFSGVTIVTLSQLGFIQSNNNNEKLSIRDLNLSRLPNALAQSRKLHIIDIFKQILIKCYSLNFLYENINRLMSLTSWTKNFVVRQKTKLKGIIKYIVIKKLNLEPHILNFYSFRECIKYKIKEYRNKSVLDTSLDMVTNIIKGKNSNFFSFKGPEFAQIDLTNKCNLNCLCCWFYSPLLSQKRKPYKGWKNEIISPDKAKRLIEELSFLGTKTIHLGGGGDPGAYPDILDIINYIKNHNIEVSINTNLTLFSKDKLNSVMEAGVQWFTLSLWAGSTEAYTAVHPNQNEKTFENIKTNLKTIQDFKSNNSTEKPTVMVINVITNKNYHDLLNMYNLALKYNIDIVWYQVFDPIDDTSSLCLSKKQKEKVFEQSEKILTLHNKNRVSNKNYKLQLWQFKRFSDRLKDEKEEKKGFYDYNRTLSIPCYAGWTFVRIAANGDVIPCCKGYGNKTGNINKKSFVNIWNSWLYKEFRKFSLYHHLDNPIFKGIAENGCLKTCDNYQSNLEYFRKVFDAEP